MPKELSKEGPYTVESDPTKECSACGAGRIWAVVDSTNDCEMFGVRFEEEEAADDLCGVANQAWKAGYEAGIAELSIEWLCRRCFPSINAPIVVVHPKQRDGFLQPCPVCRSAMEPTNRTMRELERVKEALNNFKDTIQKLLEL